MTIALSLYLSILFQRPVYIIGPCPLANCAVRVIVPIVIEKEVVRHVDPPLGNIPHVARL